MPLAITSYYVVMAFHIMAVVAAFGLPMSYPLFLPYIRRKHPRALAGVHDAQLLLNQRVTGIGTGLILIFGAYMASKQHLWGEVWVQVPITILVIIGALGGMVIIPSARKMAALAQDAIDAAGPTGEVVLGEEYERVYARYLQTEVLLGVLVLVAIFFMTAKPFA